MNLAWEGGRAVADREMLAALYEVSERSVRRHCVPLEYTARRGVRWGGTVRYDVLAAGEQLAEVASRPARAAVAKRFRLLGRAA